MDDNWIVENLENALATWNEKLAEIWQLVSMTPKEDVYKRQHRYKNRKTEEKKWTQDSLARSESSTFLKRQVLFFM